MFRRARPELFREGAYTPLAATGDAEEHIVAFARTRGDQEALAVAPRLLAKRLGEATSLPLGMAWNDTMLALPAGNTGRRYRNVFTDEVVVVIERDGVVGLPLANVLKSFPVALLERLENEEVAEGRE
jgi:(1->4)-alpha-D-glucan 1-alpha-D-glucosylmutase